MQIPRFSPVRASQQQAPRNPAPPPAEQPPAEPPAQESPMAGHKIMLDPGHGGKFPGARGATGLNEKDVTLAICLEMQKQLKAAGADVRMTRDTDATVAPPSASLQDDLKARVSLANNWPAEIFISVHCNSAENTSAKGTEGYHGRNASASSKRLAAALHTPLVALGLQDRGVKAADFHVIKNTSMPSTLVETAFISNAGDEAKLGDPAWQKTAATALVGGVQNYFSELAEQPPEQSEGFWGCWQVA